MLVDGTRDRKVFGLVTVIGSCVMGLAGWGVMSATNRYGKDMEQDLKKNRSMAQMHTAKNNGQTRMHAHLHEVNRCACGCWNVLISCVG